VNLDLVQDRIWALHPAKMDEIDAVISQLLAGVKIDFDAAKYQAETGNRPFAPYTGGSIAVIDVFGTISQRASLMSSWSGGTSSEKIGAQIREALDNPEIGGIILRMNSPGGTVHGVSALADLIRQGREKKRIVGFCDGLMCSACYWIGSACTTVVATKTSEIGSIGVIATHYDMSERDKQNGVTRTFVTAGKYKIQAPDNAPLSKEGLAGLQDAVDTYYSIFIDAVSENRAMETEDVLKMADGRTFVGQAALDIGLIDNIGNFDLALKLVREGEHKTMDEKEKKAMEERLLALEKQNGELMATLSANDAVMAEAKRREAELAAQVKRKSIELSVRKLVDEGKVTPAKVDAGLVDFLVALDGLGEIAVTVDGEEKKVLASEWMVEHVLSAAVPMGLNRDVAVDGTAKPKTDKEVELGCEIAAYLNLEGDKE
jgi:signal peptide peptidase SppA